MPSPIISALFSKGALIDLDIGRWSGTKTLTEEDLLLSPISKSAVHLGHKRLLPASALSKITAKENTTRNTLNKLTSSFPVTGTRFATFSMLPAIIKNLEDAKVYWETAVQVFLDQYEEAKKVQLANLSNFHTKIMEDELAKTVLLLRAGRAAELSSWLTNKNIENEKLYPSKEELTHKFSFSWRIFKVEPIDGKMEVKALAETQNKLEADLKTWVKDACSQMHKTLGEAAAHSQVLLEKNGKLNAANLKPLFDAFELFSSMDFVGSSFQNTIDSMKAYKALDFSGVNNMVDWKATAEKVEEDQEGFSNLLKSISVLAVEETAKVAGISTLASSTEFSRLVELE